MTNIKDNFTSRSDLYARYRPSYPPEVFEFLSSKIPGRQAAWDCGTGNGQLATELAHHFHTVYATDISKEQIEQAVPAPNLEYSVQPAEQTSFPDNSFDLVTVAQAIHWFDFKRFYREVERCTRNQGIFAALGYGLVSAGGEADEIIGHFYRTTLDTYWDKERKYIDEHYKTIPFPFEEITAPTLVNEVSWSLDDLAGFFRTWSAVKHYIKANNQDPVEPLVLRLEKVWGDAVQRSIQFPILLRVARITK
ncbi:MAG: methyltransferase domain-containing protein [Bacteroidota bacterium]